MDGKRLKPNINKYVSSKHNMPIVNVNLITNNSSNNLPLGFSRTNQELIKTNTAHGHSMSKLNIVSTKQTSTPDKTTLPSKSDMVKRILH